MSNNPLLEIDDLRVTFPTDAGPVQAVRGVHLAVGERGVLGVVGESGCGKTVTMLAVLGLLPSTASVTGSVRYRGRELLGGRDEELRRIRGSKIAMIFQDPVASLNPVFTVGHQIAEAIRVHNRQVSRKEARRRAMELLALVGIPDADRRAGDYPHQFSGGMCQRAMIAIAVANDPDVLIADEPTTALDVTIQAQVLDVLADIRAEKGTALVLITHDLGVMAGVAEEVAVMYAGQVVERGPVDDIYERSRHPYTRGLLASLPLLNDEERRRLLPIEGGPPSLLRVPPACAFHPRCPHVQPVCRQAVPELRPVGPVLSACHCAESLDAAVQPAASR